MPVSLRRMTPDEFGPYEDADARTYADARVKAGYWSAKGAFRRAKEIHAKLLPQGVNTKDHYPLVVEASEEARPIGVLWFSVNHETETSTGFIYDLLIHEPFRRKGYGRQAMLASEDRARELGVATISLHVYEDTEPARLLYAILGYQVKSMNMTKVVPSAADQGAA